MTISSTTRKAGPFVGNGVATSFAFTFKVFATSDIVATLTTIATGAESTLVLTTDYTVSLNADQNNNPGGTVTYNPSGVPMPSTKKLTLTSNVLQTQSTDITNAGGFYPEVIENALDKSVILIQQDAEKLGRAMKVPVTETAQGDLPSAVARASKYLAFDAGGDPVAASGSPSGIPIETVVSVVNTVAVLKALALPSAPNTYVVRGYYAIGDGGGGTYWWNVADATADNGGTILQRDAGGAGRFNKLF